MDAWINKHNAAHHADTIKKWQTGKNEYIITAHCLVWNEQQQRQYSERTELFIKSDKQKHQITKADVTEIAILHYSDLDYPEFINLAKPKRGAKEYTIIKLDSDADMKKSSFENLAAYEFPSPYIKRPHDTIVGWNEYATDENFKRCVEINIIQQCYPLIDQRLIPPHMLSHKYIRQFMEKRGGVYTYKNIIEFIKHLGHVSIYFFDQTGQHLIDKHIAKREHVSCDINLNINEPDAENLINAETQNEINEDFAAVGLQLPPCSRPGSSNDPMPSS